MASFEPFVSSDPFSMSTFNSKLGGAFGKVDEGLASASKITLVFNGSLSDGTQVIIPENTKYLISLINGTGCVCAKNINNEYPHFGEYYGVLADGRVRTTKQSFTISRTGIVNSCWIVNITAGSTGNEINVYKNRTFDRTVIYAVE